jgi:hypothetical protein
MNSRMNLECWQSFLRFCELISDLSEGVVYLAQFEHEGHENCRITAESETMRLSNHTVSYHQLPMKVFS